MLKLIIIVGRVKTYTLVLQCVSAHRSARVLHVLSSAVVCAEFHDRLMFLRSCMKVERRVFLGLPRLLLPSDGTQFIACLANLCSGNLSMWPVKRTHHSVTISCKRDDELLYRTSLLTNSSCVDKSLQKLIRIVWTM